MHPNRSKGVILGAFRMPNNAALYGGGTVLRHPVVKMSCAAISLATAAKGGVGHSGGLVVHDNHGNVCGKFESVDNGNAVATLPGFCWRALDVSTEDIVNARDKLRGQCTWKGLKICKERDTSKSAQVTTILSLHLHDPNNPQRSEQSAIDSLNLNAINSLI